MPIFIMIGVIVLLLGILVLIAIQKQKKNNMLIKELERNHPAPQEKLPFLALGNILLLDEPKKTLKILDSEHAKKKLAADWDITGRESAISTIQWLFEEGHRKTCHESYTALRDAIAKGSSHELASNVTYIKDKLREGIDATDAELQSCEDVSAFDFERAAAIARFSYNLGFISEEECYAYLEEAHQKTVAIYQNWRDYAIAFYIGFTICVNSPNPSFMIRYAKDCLQDQTSLWNLYPLTGK